MVITSNNINDNKESKNLLIEIKLNLIRSENKPNTTINKPHIENTILVPMPNGRPFKGIEYKYKNSST
jgi:hypothetical protein